jgi:integrase
MDECESWQRDRCAGQGRRSLVPLRGLVLIAYRTMMRPSNNFSLRWEQLTIDQERMRGSFTLVEHKNQSRGFDVVGPLGRSVIDYLVGIMPSSKPTGLVHPNTDGKPFTNIRRSWARLIAFANSILAPGRRLARSSPFTICVTQALQLWLRVGPIRSQSSG